jgi:hypothetical protein
VAVAGDVTEPWQVETIGAEQAGNDPAALYVTLEDALSNAVTVDLVDPQATVLDSWQEWRIPFEDFISGGMDMGIINRMTIGIGDRNQATPGGRGMVFVDEIKIGHPVGSE